MIYSNKKLKTFISFFILIIIFLSIVLPKINDDEYYAAIVIKSSSANNTKETTKKKHHGSAMPGAQYYEELWDKNHVIAADNGGGSGEGGGAGDSDAKNAGNAGEYDEAGGTFGGAAGIGLGSGDTKNLSGEGAGNRGGSTGSVTADALRQLRINIEESRAESIAKVLESAVNAESVAASIAEREREQESIQRKMQQESVKARLAAASRTDNFGAYDNKVPPSRNYTTARETIEVSEPRANVIVREETFSPVNSNITLYDGNNMVPSEVNTEVYDNYISIPMTETVATFYENNSIDVPTTVRDIENQYEEVSTVVTLETFDTPLVYEETSTIIEEEILTEAQTVEITTEKETENLSDETEGKGSKGGKDAEADEDLKGDDGENESQGSADEKGKYQLETKGEFAGKKIFELKQNGNFGFEPEHLSVAGLKNFMTSVLTLLMLIGALLFIVSTKDKNGKGSYF